MSILAGKTSLVTGAGGEIGSALAAGLAQNGSRVAVCDIDMEAADITAQGIIASGGQAIACQLDVSRENDWQDTMRRIDAELGALDVLVNCAGLFSDKAYPIGEMPLEEWRRLHSVNLDGSFLGIKAGVNSMGTRNGSIINVGSVVGFFGARSGAAYGTSKAAIRGLTTQAAASCIAAGSKIRINAIHPGYILTKSALGSSVARLGSVEAAKKAFATRSPMNRCVYPEALVGPVVFLASDASMHMNGSEILVDDGLSTQMPGAGFA